MPDLKGYAFSDPDVIEEYNDFWKVKKMHHRAFYQFNAAFDGTIRNLREYINYSFAKFNQFIDIPEDVEDYEIHLALPNIRNKMMAILARLSAQRMKSEFFPLNTDLAFEDDISKYIQYIYEWSDDTSNQDVVNFYWMLETAMKGTGILMEDYFQHVREIKPSRRYDATTGEITWTTKRVVEDGCHSFVVPLEEFYVWNMREPDIQKQNKCYWVNIMDFQDFKYAFKDFARVDLVQPGSSSADENKSFYNQYLHDLPGEAVEVMRVFDKENDLFKIIANGVELTQKGSPMPWNHKMQPFVKGIYEPIVADFFCGKSLPDKIGNLSDAVDQLFNDLFNLNQLNLKKPMLAKEGTVLEDSVWRPDNIIWYMGGDKPEVMQVGQSNTDFDKLNKILTEQLNLSTIAPVGQGQPGSGSTAREVILSEEHSNEMLSMFLRFMEWGEKDRAMLRISNLLQFMGTVPDIMEITGPDGVKFEADYRILKQFNAQLPNGKLGTREIRLKRQHQMLPQDQLQRQYPQANKQVVEIDIDFIRHLKFYVKVVPNSSIKISQELQRALDLEFTQAMVQLFPDLTNRMELATELVKDYKKSPDKLLQQQQQPQQTPENQLDQILGRQGQQSQQGPPGQQGLPPLGQGASPMGQGSTPPGGATPAPSPAVGSQLLQASRPMAKMGLLNR